MERKEIIGKGPNNLQHIFTAYLSKAVYRKREEHIHQIVRRQKFEMQMDEDLLADLCEMEEDWAESLPLWMRIESEMLLSALKKLNPRERAVLFVRALEEKTFRQIAAQLGMSTKGAAAVYYRALQKLRKRMGEQGR